MIACVALLTVSLFTTVSAARYAPPPAWLAVISAKPAPTIVTVLPSIVATPASEEVYVTVPPGAVAVRLKGTSPKVFVAKSLNVIVCAP